jgi:hypothetical protein
LKQRHSASPSWLSIVTTVTTDGTIAPMTRIRRVLNKAKRDGATRVLADEGAFSLMLDEVVAAENDNPNGAGMPVVVLKGRDAQPKDALAVVRLSTLLKKAAGVDPDPYPDRPVGGL